MCNNTDKDVGKLRLSTKFRRRKQEKHSAHGLYRVWQKKSCSQEERVGVDDTTRAFAQPLQQCRMASLILYMCRPEGVKFMRFNIDCTDRQIKTANECAQVPFLYRVESEDERTVRAGK